MSFWGHLTTAWDRLLVSACLIWSYWERCGLGPSSVELWIRKNRCKLCIRHRLSFEGSTERPLSWTKYSPPLPTATGSKNNRYMGPQGPRLSTGSASSKPNYKDLYGDLSYDKTVKMHKARNVWACFANVLCFITVFCHKRGNSFTKTADNSHCYVALVWINVIAVASMVSVVTLHLS